MPLDTAGINPATGTEACCFKLPVALLQRMDEYRKKTGATKTGLIIVSVEKFLEGAE